VLTWPLAEEEKRENVRRKYHNEPTEVDGIHFGSKKEASRYEQLKLCQMAGIVRNLKLQVPYKLKVNGLLVCTYKADFVYEDKFGSRWKEIIEDVKGMRTREYIIKRKLMKAIYGIEIRET
jgi:hypothetical protein